MRKSKYQYSVKKLCSLNRACVSYHVTEPNTGWDSTDRPWQQGDELKCYIKAGYFLTSRVLVQTMDVCSYRLRCNSSIL
jgi:hypothetical protein